MNQIDSKLPEIEERACHYAMLEYEINQILKEFELPTVANENEEKTIDYMYNKLNLLHNQIKMQKAKIQTLNTKLKNTEETIIECKREAANIKKMIREESAMDEESSFEGKECIFDIYNPNNDRVGDGGRECVYDGVGGDEIPDLVSFNEHDFEPQSRPVWDGENSDNMPESMRSYYYNQSERKSNSLK
jgi:hypothetical protein